MSTQHDLKAISALNAQRSARWHEDAKWNTSDWGVAMAGEAGEVCNAIKKLRRIEMNMKQTKGPQTREDAIRDIKHEIGDTFLYLDLLAQHLGLDIADCIVETFNRVSEREGFPERM